MDAFGHLSVLLSIILGLGITQVLTALGRVVRARDHVRLHAPALGWALILLLVYVQVWWSMFGLRGHADWTFPQFATVLTQAILLYLLAALALPEDLLAEPDLARHYARQSPWFFGVLLGALLVSVAKDPLLHGSLASGGNLAFHALFAAGCIAAMTIRSHRFHVFAMLLSALSILAYIAMLFWRLG